MTAPRQANFICTGRPILVAALNPVGKLTGGRKAAIAMQHLGKKLRGGVLVGLGYMLSPLSWWNDVFFNLPIAIAFGYVVGWLHSGWFVPGTLAGYWLSNVAGMVMMQFGATDLLLADSQHKARRDLLIGFGSSTLYTLVVVALVYWHLLEIPPFLQNLKP